jgi:hypothetical protein
MQKNRVFHKDFIVFSDRFSIVDLQIDKGGSGMKKIDRNFIGRKLLVCGATPKDMTHVKILYKDFTEDGIDLFLMSTTPKTDIGFKTYDSFGDLPEVPECAYIMSDKEQTAGILQQVIDLGIKKILFYGPVCYSKDLEELCRTNNIDARYGCPLIFSKVIFCRIHALTGGFK